MFGLFKPKPQIMTPQRAEKVVNAYGKLMMDNPVMVGDERDLPYSKAEIKEAIKVWLKIEPRKEVAEMLKASYVSLADYLPLTPQERFSLNRQAAVQAAMPDNIDSDYAKRFLEAQRGTTALAQRVADEAAVLMAEIAVAPVWDGKTIPDHVK